MGKGHPGDRDQGGVIRKIATHAGSWRFRCYSGLMPANSITLAHLSISAAMKPLNSAGVIGRGSTPSATNFCYRLESASPGPTASLSVPTTSAGVALGAPAKCRNCLRENLNMLPSAAGSATTLDHFIAWGERAIDLACVSKRGDRMKIR